MSKGAPASMPPSEFARVARTIHFTGVEVYGEDGQFLGSYSFDVTGCSDTIKRQFAAAFADATDHGGRWRRRSTCDTAARLIRSLLTFLAASETPPKSLERVTGNHLRSFAMSRYGQSREQVTRVLRPLLESHPALREDALSFLRKRVKRQRDSAETSYSSESLRIFRAAAERTVAKARRRIETNRRALLDQSVLPIPANLPRELLEYMALNGDVPRTAGGNLRNPDLHRQLGGAPSVLTSLFPTLEEVGAAAVLLVCDQGWNVSVLHEMKVPEESPDGGVGDVAIATVHLNKPRRGAGRHHMSNSIVDAGPGSRGRLLAQIVAMTGPARATMASQGISTQRLLLGRREKFSAEANSVWIEGVPRNCVREWCRQIQLSDETGRRVDISMRRLRRTVVVTRGEPLQHTDDTLEATYQGRDQRLRSESAEIIEQGITDALQHAEAQMRAYLGDEQSPGEIASLAGISIDAAEGVLSGENNTVLGSCLDVLHSPLSGNGPCDVSFLLCLACPLAVATSQHLPRLVLLHDHLSQLRSAISAEAWVLDWRAHWERINDLLDRFTTDAERSQARASASEQDHELIGRLLDRRLDR